MEEQLIKSEKYRFIILTIFALFLTFNTFQSLEYSVIAKSMTEFYDVTNYSIDFISTVHKILAIFLIYPITLMIENYENKPTMILVTGFGALSAIVKCFTLHTNRFWIIILAQFISGLAQVTSYVFKFRLISMWFPDNELATALSVLTSSFLIGDAACFIRSVH